MEDARFRILQALERNPEMTHRELADILGISLGGTHNCLKELVRNGSVKVGNFRTPRNQRAHGYNLTPRGKADRAALAPGFLERRRAEHAALTAEIKALEDDLGVRAQATR